MKPLRLLPFLLVLVVLAASRAAAPTRPNFVFIFADDLGIANVGCYGADHVRTPHLDALARGGIRYTHAYTAPLCGPSRALLMTGRYAFRTGATNQDATGQMKPARETMMPRVLKAAGYVSASIGKWGQLPLTPADFGFDDYLRFSGSGIYWNTQDHGKTYVVNGETRPLRDKEYMPDLMHQRAIDFLAQHRDEPFLLYYPMSHVHREILPTPDSPPGSKDLFGDNLAYMDKLVGKLIAELERLKLREKTLVVFMGDNGTGSTEAEQSTIRGRTLSGHKGDMLEGGALVPLIVNWPGVVAAGQISDQLIDSTDFLPTFAELAGVPLPSGRVIDGHSFAAQLRGEKGRSREWIFIQLARQWYVREARWKLNQAGELFDMSGAPFEEKLVAPEAQNPAAAAARQRLQAALAQLNPAGGALDEGDGTGRHDRRNKKKRAK